MDLTLRIRKIEAITLAALFVIAITLPLVKQFAIGESDTSKLEKRKLTGFPVLTGSLHWRIVSLPQKFEDWYNDHFGCRTFLVEAGTMLNVQCFGISQRVVIGEKGWLYFKMDIPLFSQSLDDKALSKWKNYLERRQQWLAERGIKYLFVVPPDKDSIYPEFLPPQLRKPTPRLPVDQLISYLAETHSSVKILSLRESLLAAKQVERERLYFKQDTHWNSLGAFYGSDAILRDLALWLPALKPSSRTDFRLFIAPEDGRDLALLAGLPEFVTVDGPVLQPLIPRAAQSEMLPNPGLGIPPFTTSLPGAANLPRAVMLRDSFTTALTPYLSEHFSRITYIAPSYSSVAQEKMITDTVTREKPDVFIEERVQRYILATPNEKIVFGGNSIESGK